MLHLLEMEEWVANFLRFLTPEERESGGVLRNIFFNLSFNMSSLKSGASRETELNALYKPLKEF